MYFIIPIFILWVKIPTPKSQVLLSSGYIIYNNQSKISNT